MLFIFLQRCSNGPIIVVWLEKKIIYFYPAKVTCPSYNRANKYQFKNTVKIPFGFYRTCNSWVTSCQCPPPSHICEHVQMFSTSLGETTQKTPTNMDKGFLSKAQECDFHPQPFVHGPAEVTANGQHARIPQHRVSERDNEQLAHASSALTSLPQVKNGPSPEVPCIFLK